MGGIGLEQVLARRALAGNPQADTAVILFWMWGGPSHLETYDLKPLAPSEYRGPFRPMATDVPGLDICELFPLQAKLGSRISLIRSLHHDMSAHNDGSIELLTGKTPERQDPTSTAFSEHPDFGMVASKLRGTRPDGLPHYVGVPRQPFMTRPVYLGLAHSAVAAGDPADPAYRPPNLTLAAGIDAARLDQRRGLLPQFDRLRRDLDLGGSLDGVDQFRGQALRMLTNPAIAGAFEIGREDEQLRDRYGRRLWGQSCLLARRLVEAGVSVVTIDARAPSNSDRYFSWDDHLNPLTRWGLEGAMRHRAPFMDQGLATLIEDVYQRGLSQRMLIVAVGEFGRTPRLVERDGLLGRDHWPGARSALCRGADCGWDRLWARPTRKGNIPRTGPFRPRT